MSFSVPLVDESKKCDDCEFYRGAWCCTMNCGGVAFDFGGGGKPITEEWLGEVGFKWIPENGLPGVRWFLTFAEPEFFGLCVEVFKAGSLDSAGAQLEPQCGWLLWIGRENGCLPVRHVHTRAEIFAFVEALAGQSWVPSPSGSVPVVGAET